MKHKSIMRIFIIIITMAFAASVILLFSFTADDSYIVMRYAENFAETGSLSFNIGERICMFTSPIQPFIEALLYKITNQTLFSYKIFSFILLMASVIIIYKMFTGEIFLQLYILSVLLLSPPIILWTSGGLETPILLFITTLISMLTISKEQPNLKDLIAIYILAGIAFVTRYDASLFVFPVVLYPIGTGTHRASLVPGPCQTHEKPAWQSTSHCWRSTYI